MIVDDSTIDQKIQSKIIQHSKLFTTIINCYSTDDAIKYLFIEEKCPEFIIPDIILLDIGMPEKNGFDFLSEFKRHYHKDFEKVKIFILSSTIDYIDISKANAEEKVVDILTKPLSLDKFIAVTKQHLF